MSSAPQFQRARRPEHKEERREAILLAARELAVKRPVREVSLGDIARRAGFAKSNLLRYFDSREDIFLQLLLREWDAWRAELGERLGSPAATDAVPAAIARTLAGRPLFCDLISQMASVLERNVSVPTARAFKAEMIEKVDDLGAALNETLPRLSPSQSREAIAATLIITAGLWPLANPAPHVAAMLADVPELARAHVDFEDRLHRLLAALITGFLAGSP